MTTYVQESNHLFVALSKSWYNHARIKCYMSSLCDSTEEGGGDRSTKAELQLKRAWLALSLIDVGWLGSLSHSVA